ncbi:MAG: radical SAM protein [Lentisphaerae bacterium]|jgi:pyruvate formate lyase activating enzyme|nr:radical SAM protein [Lentisphaerota bacterium]
MRGRIHSIETLGALDGPGLRTVVFFQGCPLRCKYCHNPDSWNFAGGVEMESEAIMAKLRRSRPYYGDLGGVTFSGGEPCAQPGFLGELVELCKREGIHTALDTSGGCWSAQIEDIAQACDLILLDIKAGTKQQFEWLTDHDSFHNLLHWLDFLRKTNHSAWIRQVVGIGLNDTEEDKQNLMRLLDGIQPEKIEFLPYHDKGRGKWQALGLDYVADQFFKVK